MFDAKWNRMSNAQKVERVKQELEKDIARWKFISENGCSDPFWPDGANMNLVRNHIIHELKLLEELDEKPMQLTIFMMIDRGGGVERDKRVPPKVADDYMVKDRPCGYFYGRKKQA